MLGPFGETLLLDWGIAKVLNQPEGKGETEDAPAVRVRKGDSDTETQAGTIAGSPSYMAPEAAAGLNEQIDEKSDVYLLGGILYEMLTGTVPRKAASMFDLIQLAQREPPAPPRKINPQIPRALEAVCLKAIAFRKEDRYSTALELAEDVQRLRRRRAGLRVPGGRAGPAVALGEAAAQGPDLVGRRRAGSESRAVRVYPVSAIGAAPREAQREAEELKTLEQARRDVKEFRRLADEARYYAATTDAVAEHAPYFDPEKGYALGRAAMAQAAAWGPAVEDLPLAEERPLVKKDLYDLLLLTAQARSQPGAKPEQVREVIELLGNAPGLREPSRGYYRLLGQAYRQIGEAKQAALAQQQADNPRTPAVALDSFLLGEQYRTEAARRKDADTQGKAWKSDPRRLKQAVEQYQLALQADPEHYWSHFQLGRCYMSLGRYAEAVEALGACIALRPEAAWGYSAPVWPTSSKSSIAKRSATWTGRRP